MSIILIREDNTVFEYKHNLLHNSGVKAIAASYNNFFVAYITEDNRICVHNSYSLEKKILDVKTISIMYNSDKLLYISEDNILFQYDEESYQLSDHKCIKVSCGPSHMIMITENYDVYSSGVSKDGRLGLPNLRIPNYSSFVKIPNFKAVSASCGAYHSMFITEDNRVFACGSNQYGQLGLNIDVVYTPLQLNIEAVSVECYDCYTIFITKDNDVFVCGRNCNNVLGIPGNSEIYFPTQIPNFKAVSVTCTFNCTKFINEDGVVFICGYITGFMYRTPTEIPNFIHKFDHRFKETKSARF